MASKDITGRREVTLLVSHGGFVLVTPKYMGGWSVQNLADHRRRAINHDEDYKVIKSCTGL